MTDVLLPVAGAHSSLRLKWSHNVLLSVWISDLHQLATINLLLALACVINVAINIACIFMVANKGATSDQVFHNIEFSASFVFALVQVLAVFYAFKVSTIIIARPWALKFVVLLNVAGTLLPALLVYVNLEKWETISHEIEYTNSLCSALVDLLMSVQILEAYFKSGDRGQFAHSGAIFIVPVLV